MRFFHISHTDLDGYGCQLITKKVFPDAVFYNANYGLEVKLFLKDALEKIELIDKNIEIFLLITDLNLTTDEAKKLHRDITRLNDNGHNIKLQLLDHHGTGQKSADKFDWYYLDTSRSATKITYDYFMQNYSDFKDKCEDNFEQLIDAINAVDIWLDEDQLFEFGKVCLTMISKSYEINNLLFSTKSRNFKFHLLSSALKYVSLPNGHIKLDENIYYIKKEYLNISSNDDTIENLSSNYLVNSLENIKDSLTVYYKEHKGLLTYGLGGISIPANAFLKANLDYHFFIDISKRGRSGIRANNQLDVSVLAQKLAGGGGHPNASGMAFKDFKETVIYDEVKDFMQNKLDNCG
ncbi:MAG: phosphoesterase [Campylobacterota bacterium]|nr:phosphoesterase [Campylobacterota bacterium]